MRTSKLLTPGRVLVGLLVVVNVGFAALLFVSLDRTAALERRVDAPPPPVRAERQEHKRVVDVARPTLARIEPAAVDSDGRTPPDQGAVLQRLVDLVHPDSGHEKIMRDAFERHYPAAEAAYHAHDEATAAKAWRKYCDELAPSFDERALKRLGCIEAPMARAVAAQSSRP